jgi:uncharacterized delta-60 repeat protein
MLARFPRRPSLTLVGVVALVLAMANPAAAPPGDLDTTFDGDGKVTTDFASNTDSADAVAIQGDGKIVTAGFAFVSGTEDFALTRYNTDGSLDTTFDGDGKVTTDFGGTDQAHGVAIQADGKIVAVGSTRLSGPNDFALARYNSDGSLDTSFDGDGRVTGSFAIGVANAVVIQADGRIVAAGLAVVSGNTDFALARYNTDGSLDTAFDGDGRVNTDFAGSTDDAHGVAIQADGKIVATGYTVSGTYEFALARYNTDGSLDTSFDGDGKVTTDFAGGVDQAFGGVAIQADGKIVAAGCLACFSGTPDFALARYNTDGSLDTTFDGDGKVTTDFAAAPDIAYGVVIQANGKIVVAGEAVVSGIFDFALARYNTDGSLDTTFSGDGKVTTDFTGSEDRARAVVIQANGRIVAAGFARVSGTGADFALARYTCLRRTSRPMSIPLCP